jgi:hypothetical protein
MHLEIKRRVPVDRERWIGVIAAVDPIHAASMHRHPVQLALARLPFYRRHRTLVRAEIALQQRVVSLHYAGDLTQVRPLAGPSDLAALNREEGLELQHGQLSDYLRLYFLIAGYGRWRLIERAEEVPFAALSHAELAAWRRRVHRAIRPLQVRLRADGSMRAKATLLDRSDLAELHLSIQPQGDVAVRRSFGLMSELPVGSPRW